MLASLTGNVRRLENVELSTALIATKVCGKTITTLNIHSLNEKDLYRQVTSILKWRTNSLILSDGSITMSF